MMTRFAATRLMPSEPALVEMRNKRPLCMKKRKESISEHYLTHDYMQYEPFKQKLQISEALQSWCHKFAFFKTVRTHHLVLLVSLNSSAHFFLVVALVEPSRR